MFVNSLNKHLGKVITRYIDAVKAKMIREQEFADKKKKLVAGILAPFLFIKPTP